MVFDISFILSWNLSKDPPPDLSQLTNQEMVDIELKVPQHLFWRLPLPNLCQVCVCVCVLYTSSQAYATSHMPHGYQTAWESLDVASLCCCCLLFLSGANIFVDNDDDYGLMRHRHE